LSVEQKLQCDKVPTLDGQTGTVLSNSPTPYRRPAAIRMQPLVAMESTAEMSRILPVQVEFSKRLYVPNQPLVMNAAKVPEVPF
jgi:hypothetical protein